MPDPTDEFFEQLGRRGHEPVLEDMNGTMRFDVADEHGTDHWFVLIKGGDVRASRADHPADCIVHTSRALMNQMITGQLPAQVAWLRRLLWVEGNLVMLRIFERIFAGPPGARDPRDLVAEARRRR